MYCACLEVQSTRSLTKRWARACLTSARIQHARRRGQSSHIPPGSFVRPIRVLAFRESESPPAIRCVTAAEAGSRCDLMPCEGPFIIAAARPHRLHSVAFGGVRSSAIGAAVAEFSRWLCSALFSARYHPPTHTHITCSCGSPGAGARLFWRSLRGVECRLAEQRVASVRRHRDRARHSGQALQCEGADGVASKLGQIRKLDSSRPPQEHRARYRSQCTIT